MSVQITFLIFGAKKCACADLYAFCMSAPMAIVQIFCSYFELSDFLGDDVREGEREEE